MEVEAVGRVGAGERAAVVRAVGHAASGYPASVSSLTPLQAPLQKQNIKKTNAQIILVQKLALLPLLAQAAQPMLAH